MLTVGPTEWQWLYIADLFLLRSTALSLVWGLGTVVLSRRSASTKHWLALCTLAAIALLPLWHWVLPANPLGLVEVVPPPLVTGNLVLITEPANAISPRLVSAVLAAIYGVVALWLLLRVVLDLVAINRLVRQVTRVECPTLNSQLNRISRALGICKPVVLYEAPNNLSPATWGSDVVNIVMPTGYRQWQESRLLDVLTHELAHVRRNDWQTLMLTRVLCALLWFVPWVWLLRRQIMLYAELATDDLVVSLTCDNAGYAESLLALANTPTTAAAMPAAPALNTLSGRIHYILADDRPHHAAGVTFKLATMVLVTLLMLPIAALQLADYLPPLRLELAPVQSIADETTEEQAPIGSAIATVPTRAELVPNRVQPEFRGVAARWQGDEQLIQVRQFQISTSMVWESDRRLAQPTVITGAELLNSVRPVYPNNAIRRDIEGEVVIEFDLTVYGDVQNVRVSAANPQGYFENSAVEAFRKARFTPLLEDGVPRAAKGLKRRIVYRLQPLNDQTLRRP